MNEGEFANFGKYLRYLMLKCHLATVFSLDGCSEAEIELIKQDQRVDFIPKIYYEFLTEMGNEAGDLFSGSSFVFGGLIGLKASINDEYERRIIDFRIPEDAIVFMEHGGSGYWYFYTRNRDDDPPIFVFDEVDNIVKKIADKLSVFYIDAIKDQARECF